MEIKKKTKRYTRKYNNTMYAVNTKHGFFFFFWVYNVCACVYVLHRYYNIVCVVTHVCFYSFVVVTRGASARVCR